jgi:hypothetical protein
VQVCSFRIAERGGGPRRKDDQPSPEETGLTDAVQVNVWTVKGNATTDPTFVDGRIDNGVKGLDAL